MKYALRFFIAFFVVLPFLVLSLPAQAHMVGQPPFFKINGTYSDLYPVPTTSLANFILPQDLAKENYLVGKPISFEIDTAPLSVPAEIVQKTTFSWDFGDGTSGLGLKNTHTYQKAGSYVITIYVQYDQISGKQLFQSVLLNVIPDTNYQLPKAKISIEGKTSREPFLDILKFPFGTKLNFDASGSTAPSSKIVDYFWDFGDSQSAGGEKVSHTYSKDLPQQQVFSVLRTRDDNGFIADTFVEVDNRKGESTSATSNKGTGNLVIWGLGIGILSLFVFVFLKNKK